MIDTHQLNDLAGIAEMAKAGQYVTLSQRSAGLILDVLHENAALREQVEESSNPARILRVVQRMIAAAGEVLRGGVESEGDALDHLVTQTEQLEEAVERERKAASS